DFDAIQEKSGCECQPGRRSQVILVIDCYAFEERPGRSNECRSGKKAVLIWIIDLSLLIVINDELVLPPIVDPKIHMRRDEPFLSQKMIDRFRIENCVWVTGFAFRIDEQTADPHLIARRKASVHDS